MHENTIALADSEAEKYSSPKSTFDRLKSINEKYAPATAAISLFLIIDGWARKDWNQIAIGFGFAFPAYYGLGENPPNTSFDVTENQTSEIEVFSNSEPPHSNLI